MDLNADVVGLSEVENAFVIQDLLNNYTEREYSYIIMTLLMKEVSTTLLSTIKIDSRSLPAGDQKPLLNNDRTRDILLVMRVRWSCNINLCLPLAFKLWWRRASEPKRMATAALVKSEVLKILDKDPKLRS